jgi:predicted small metal-binding protein
MNRPTASRLGRCLNRQGFAAPSGTLRAADLFELEEEIDMRLFECGTLVPGCAWHTRADNDAEIVRRAVDHMKTAHGETMIRENMVDNIKSRIRDEANAAE